MASGGTGLRIEDRGFGKYRSDVLTEVEAAAAAEEKRALSRAAKARKNAELKLKRIQQQKIGSP